jgi:hypothetical protein
MATETSARGTESPALATEMLAMATVTLHLSEVTRSMTGSTFRRPDPRPDGPNTEPNRVPFGIRFGIRCGARACSPKEIHTAITWPCNATSTPSDAICGHAQYFPSSPVSLNPRSGYKRACNMGYCIESQDLAQPPRL